MLHERISLQPTLRQLLRSAALSEAQVVSGQEQLDRRVSQVVSGLTVGNRPGSLVVVRVDAPQAEPAALKDLAGLIVIRPVTAALATAAGRARTTSGIEVEVENLKAVCAEARIPLVLLPGLGEPVEIAGDIRAAYLSEVKKASAQIHERFVQTVILEGIEGLVELVSTVIGRPLALETSDFKLIAATQNMSSTPPNQQKTLTEEVAEELNREMRDAEEGETTEIEPVRLGRRLVYPVVLDGTTIAYLSVMIRATDDDAAITEYLRPCATACLVDFVNRRKEVSATVLTHRGVLKDLLSGESLPSAEQEQMEQYFGFDICDGLLVLAVATIPENAGRVMQFAGDRQAVVEFEGASVFVMPFDSKKSETWQKTAGELAAQVKHHTSARHVQVGAGRVSPTTMDLADGYSEARQALVTGSMIHGDNDFIIGYGDLGIKRLLYLIIDHPELDRFYQEHLEPLEAYDEEWETDLLPTLRVYLEQGANLNSAAKELFIHRHTMRYRLEQIAELLKMDIDSPEVLLNLQIAFQIRNMKGKT